MKTNLVKLNIEKNDFIFDLRYATNNNFTKKILYKSKDCFIHKIAFEHLCIAQKIAEKIGLKLKIFDAYRPVYVQEKLWEILPNANFIAPPEKGSPHSRGVAIDLTLVDNKGKELNMGTEFDEFSRLSFHGCTDISSESYKNRLLLLGIMTDAGWDFFRNEWWHYQLFNSRKYPIIKDEL